MLCCWNKSVATTTVLWCLITMLFFIRLSKDLLFPSYSETKITFKPQTHPCTCGSYQVWTKKNIVVYIYAYDLRSRCLLTKRANKTINNDERCRLLLILTQKRCDMPTVATNWYSHHLQSFPSEHVWQHSQTHAYARTQTHTHTHTHTQTLTYTDTHARAHARAESCSRSSTQLRSHSYVNTDKN